MAAVLLLVAGMLSVLAESNPIAGLVGLASWQLSGSGGWWRVHGAAAPGDARPWLASHSYRSTQVGTSAPVTQLQP